MAVSFIWPASLPQCPKRDGFSEDFGLRVNRTNPDAGPPKTQLLGVRPSIMSLVFEMSDAQEAILRDFVTNSIKGVIRFGFPHPRSGAQIEVQFRPETDGKFYSISYAGFGSYDISFTLEVLP